MKNLNKYITIASALMSLVACSMNQPPVFNDADAFVAFDEVATTVDEDYSQEGNAFSVPVTLASVAGLEAAVGFEVVELSAEELEKGWKPAKLDINFKLSESSESGVLKFDSKNRSQVINIETIMDGEYTGDLKFHLRLKPVDGVNLGAAYDCVVTISDKDHPLSFILGEYDVHGEALKSDGSAFAPVDYVITVKKDEKDVSKVWFDNIFALDGWKGDDMLYYGIVDVDNATITLPLGQAAEYKYKYSDGDHNILLWGLDEEGSFIKSGNLIFTIKTDAEGKCTGLDFDMQSGIAVFVENLGWLSVINAGAVATKK